MSTMNHLTPELDQDRQRLRKQLLDGAASPAAANADEAYFIGLRNRVDRRC